MLLAALCVRHARLRMTYSDQRADDPIENVRIAHCHASAISNIMKQSLSRRECISNLDIPIRPAYG